MTTDAPTRLSRTALSILVACWTLAAGRPTPAQAAQTLRVDYAYYNPLSLVLKDKHWLEAALGPDVTVQWVFRGCLETVAV